MGGSMQPKKSFFKRFLVAHTHYHATGAAWGVTGGEFMTGEAWRIKANFAPDTKSGSYINPPTIVDEYLYIGTSINSSMPVEKDNFFYKLDFDLAGVAMPITGGRKCRYLCSRRV